MWDGYAVLTLYLELTHIGYIVTHIGYIVTHIGYIRYPYWIHRHPYWIHRHPFWIHRHPFWINRHPYWIHRYPYWIHRYPYWIHRYPYWIHRHPCWIHRPHVGYIVNHVGYIVNHVGYIVTHIGYIVTHIGYIVTHIGYIVTHMLDTSSPICWIHRHPCWIHRHPCWIHRYPYWIHRYPYWIHRHPYWIHRHPYWIHRHPYWISSPILDIVTHFRYIVTHVGYIVTHVGYIVTHFGYIVTHIGLKYESIHQSYLKSGCQLCQGLSFEPEFIEPIKNVTAAIGRQATLSCAVSHLGSNKVAWVKADTQTILSIHHHVITRNYRITTSRSDEKYWYLHIRDVRETDRGLYMCQINTVPMKSQVGYLEIVYPPNIVDTKTSNDVVVKENDNVLLTCHADGHPQPFIIWRREDGKVMPFGNLEVETVDGENLNITRVSRLHMAAYLCIASNGVPPSVSKRIVLQVHFSPHTWIPNQLVGGYLGGEVVLECNTEAFPKSINYWTTAEGDMITSGDKYESVLIDDVYKVFMRLKIRNLEKKDFGMYRCIARNFLGETDGSVHLYAENILPNNGLAEIAPRTVIPTTTTEKANFETKDHLGGNGDHNPINDIDDIKRESSIGKDGDTLDSIRGKNGNEGALVPPSKQHPNPGSADNSASNSARLLTWFASASLFFWNVCVL